MPRETNFRLVILIIALAVFVASPIAMAVDNVRAEHSDTVVTSTDLDSAHAAHSIDAHESIGADCHACGACSGLASQLSAAGFPLNTAYPATLSGSAPVIEREPHFRPPAL